MSDRKSPGCGQWAFLQLHLPGKAKDNIGVLLLDEQSDELHVKMRPNWWLALPEEWEVEMWRELESDLKQQSLTNGGGFTFGWLTSTASHTLSVSTPEKIQFGNESITGVLERLYDAHISRIRACAEAESSKAAFRRVRTHVRSCHFNYTRILTAAAAVLILCNASRRAQIPLPSMSTPPSPQILLTTPIDMRSHVLPNLHAVDEKKRKPGRVRTSHLEPKARMHARLRFENVVYRPPRIPEPVLPPYPKVSATLAVHTIPYLEQLPSIQQRPRHPIKRFFAALGAPFRSRNNN